MKQILPLQNRIENLQNIWEIVNVYHRYEKLYFQHFLSGTKICAKYTDKHSSFVSFSQNNYGFM